MTTDAVIAIISRTENVHHRSGKVTHAETVWETFQGDKLRTSVLVDTYVKQSYATLEWFNQTTFVRLFSLSHSDAHTQLITTSEDELLHRYGLWADYVLDELVTEFARTHIEVRL